MRTQEHSRPFISQGQAIGQPHLTCKTAATRLLGGIVNWLSASFLLHIKFSIVYRTGRYY